jgi:hypothetical protein
VSQDIRDRLLTMQKLIDDAQSPDTKALLQAILLQTEVMNARLAPIENALIAIARLTAHKP